MQKNVQRRSMVQSSQQQPLVTSRPLTPTAWSPHHPRRTSNHHKRILERCHGIKGIRIVVLRIPSLPIQPPRVAPRTPSPTTDAPPVSRSHSHRRPPPSRADCRLPIPGLKKTIHPGAAWRSKATYACSLGVSRHRVDLVEYPSGTFWITNLPWSSGLVEVVWQMAEHLQDCPLIPHP
ncbi:hypothetical protein BDP81DRAFT_114897 [Colletotrichum phormii]|uniref:Uncharacterized protein n=1 Tax=Colletotrichum phormii TaxID=359342 RepID=A0AAI9ZG73_9PEZI|nr:uncharacterized protein BDP81DRAFT_114897 [Colletotrichum phormii]KAK1623960.1 hypothetical protein BDP81DRAFT_114897 [Colletotrichum phormii]